MAGKNWFSNFLPFDEPMVIGQYSYATVEHYYQAKKTLDKDWRKSIAESRTPGQAKMLGRQAPLRRQWERKRIMAMKTALYYKFAFGTSWRRKLMRTEGEIVEWNYWHDNFWGSCVCNKCKEVEGENMLGKLLMQIRDGGKEEE